MNGNKCVPTPILRYSLETIISGTSNIISTNVDRVYDLTIVHPGVKCKLHTLSQPPYRKECGCGCMVGLNTSWSTLKDQCRCVINRMRDNERASNG